MFNKLTTYTVLLLLTALTVPICSQQVNDLAYVSYRKNAIDSSQYANPAFMDGLFLASYRSIGVSYYNNEHKKGYSQQSGNAQNNYRLGIDSYTKKGGYTFYSQVYYQDGSVHNVRWNNVNYSPRLGPYVLADSIGGKEYSEDYYFKGGLAHKFNNFSWGIEAAYQAQISHRKLDPRPKVNTSILTIKPGGAFTLNQYKLGLHIAVDRYEQSINMRMYGDEKRSDFFYFLEGLGFYDKKISKPASFLKIHYSSRSLETGLQFVPIKTNGVFATFKWNNSYSELYYNLMYPSLYKQNKLFGKIGWQKLNDSYFIQLIASANVNYGDGLERVYENYLVDPETKTNNVRLLTESDNYTMYGSQFKFSAFMSSNISDKIKVFGRAFVESKEKSEEYLRDAKSSYRFTNWGVQPSIQVLFNDSYLEFSGDYSNYLNQQNNIQGVPDGVIKDKQILPTWSYLTSDYSKSLIQIKYLFKITESTAINLTTQYETRQSDNIRYKSYLLNVGLNF